MAVYETVRLDRDGEVATLTLDRPQAANTMSRQLIEDGVAACDEVRDDDQIRVLILTGAGDRHFCGGADLRDAGDAVTGDAKVRFPPRDLINELERLPQPVVAAVNGAAMGGGCELALASDFRIMAEGAKIGLTEITFGALPAGGGTQRLPRLIGMAKAKEMIYLGKRLTAQEALAIGLVTEVVPLEELMHRARAFAAELAEMAGYALEAAKYLINQGMDLDLETGLKLERRIAFTMGSPDERKVAIERAMATAPTYKNIFAGNGTS